MIYRIQRDWYTLVDIILNGQGDQVAMAKEELKSALVSVAPVFANSPFFLSDDFTLVDCVIAPLLWRLPDLSITLPAQAKSIFQYQERVFERESFQASLTEAEREIRELV